MGGFKFNGNQIFGVLKGMFGGMIMNSVSRRVGEAAARNDLSSRDKRDYVRKKLKKDLRFNNVPGYLLNMLIESAVAQLRGF